MLWVNHLAVHVYTNSLIFLGHCRFLSPPLTFPLKSTEPAYLLAQQGLDISQMLRGQGVLKPLFPLSFFTYLELGEIVISTAINDRLRSAVRSSLFIIKCDQGLNLPLIGIS